MDWSYWFDWRFMLGVIFTLFLNILGNLLTPNRPSLLRAIAAGLRHGRRSQVRQQLAALQKQLNEATRRSASSDRELFLYLVRWFLAIFSAFSLSAALAFIAMTVVDVTPLGRQRILMVSLGCLMLSSIMSCVMLDYCRHLTEAGSRKRIAALQNSIAKLTAKLPPA